MSKGKQMNEEWKNGFSEGFNKGYQLGYEKGKSEKQQVDNPYISIPNEGWKPKTSCPVCGISFTDALGRPITMGYVCNHQGCPSKMSSSIATVGTTLSYKDPT